MLSVYHLNINTIKRLLHAIGSGLRRVGFDMLCIPFSMIPWVILNAILFSDFTPVTVESLLVKFSSNLKYLRLGRVAQNIGEIRDSLLLIRFLSSFGSDYRRLNL